MHYKPTLTALVLLCASAFAQTPSTQPIPIEISKDTTRILTPLRPDGTPDYIAAYNERLANIPADQNAFPLIIQATGPLFDANQQRQFVEKFHLQPFPVDGLYLQPLYKYWGTLHPADAKNPSTEAMNKLDRLQDGFDNANVTDADRSLIIQWPDTQFQPMVLLEKASTLNLCVIPLLPKTESHLMVEAYPAFSPLLNSISPFCIEQFFTLRKVTSKALNVT